MFKAKYILFSIILPFALIGQNQLGLHSSNYSGVTGIVKNPASFQLSPLQWDAVIISGGAFIENEYAYIANASVSNLLFNDIYLVDGTFNEGYQPSENELVYRFYDAIKPMNNHINSFVGYPSGVTRINRKTSVGLFARTRQAFSARNVHQLWSYPNLNYWKYGEIQTSTPIWVAAALWTEVALNAARQFKFKNNIVSVGLNAKFLMSHDGLYAFVPSSTDITLQPRHYIVNTPEAYYGFTNFENGFELRNKGSGAGLDFGLVWMNRDTENQGYHWRLSASLIDVGWLKFNSGAQDHFVSNGSPSVLRRLPLSQIQSLTDFAQTVSNEVMGNPTTSFVAEDFTILTPAAFIFSVDYKLKPKFYANAEVARRLIFSPKQLYRENYVSVSARYETKWFEFGVPLVFYDDSNLRMGSWIRVGPLTIGSDYITTWFIKQNQLTGTDVYFALRINELTFKRNRKSKRRSPDDCFW